MCTRKYQLQYPALIVILEFWKILAFLQTTELEFEDNVLLAHWRNKKISRLIMDNFILYGIGNVQLLLIHMDIVSKLTFDKTTKVNFCLFCFCIGETQTWSLYFTKDTSQIEHIIAKL